MNGFRLGATLLLCVGLGSAQDLKEFEKKVTEFTLANGLHFIVVERHDAPVAAFDTYVNSGSANDPGGQTGVAMLTGRMALKGSETVGTLDWAAEKKALGTVEEAFKNLEGERRKGLRANSEAQIGAETQFKLAVERAEGLVDHDAHRRIIQENGGTDIKIRTLPDATEFSYSLPSNRVELWFLLESQRLLHPVPRSFYYERNNLVLEYQQNVAGKVLPRLEETLLAAAFEGHPYRNPADGWFGDLTRLDMAQSQAFQDTFYAPGNMVMSIAGDVDPAAARRLAEKYFGPLPAKPLPPLARPEEPRQMGPRTVEAGEAAQAVLLAAYKRPDQNHPDDAVLDVIQAILSGGGDGGLLQKSLVQTGIAQTASARATFPSGRYPNLFLFVISARQAHSIEDCRRALEGVLAQIASKQVDAETLDRAKAQLRANAARRLATNGDLAAVLAAYYAGYGDWRALFADLDRLKTVTADEVQRAALRYFNAAGRTVVYSPLAGRPEALGSAQ